MTPRATIMFAGVGSVIDLTLGRPGSLMSGTLPAQVTLAGLGVLLLLEAPLLGQCFKVMG